MQVFMNIKSNSDWSLHILSVYFHIAVFFHISEPARIKWPYYGTRYLSCVGTGGEHMWDTTKDSQKYLGEIFKDLQSCIMQV